jgi:molybdate transport system substrate-binding protein
MIAQWPARPPVERFSPAGPHRSLLSLHIPSQWPLHAPRVASRQWFRMPRTRSARVGNEMSRKTLSILLLMGLVLTGCGKASSPGTSGKQVKLTVAAGVKLMDVLPKIGTLFTKNHPGVTFNFVFGIADQLVTAITQGQPADVFASIFSVQGDQLVTANKIDAYTVFCTDPLLLITPTANPAGITTLQDLAAKPVKLVIAEEASVTGAVTRTALSRLDTVLQPGDSAVVLKKVMSIVQGGGAEVAAEVERGDADAGFAFITDATAFEVNRISLPAGAQAVANCPIAVLKASKNAAVAQQFIDYVLTPPAQALLAQAGFGPPPLSSS